MRQNAAGGALFVDCAADVPRSKLLLAATHTALRELSVPVLTSFFETPLAAARQTCTRDQLCMLLSTPPERHPPRHTANYL